MKVPIKSGIVIISIWKPFSLWRHIGIVSIENGIAYIYDNDPDNPENNGGGSIGKFKIYDWLKNRDVLEFYDSELSTSKIKKQVNKYWDKKFNWVTFNCRTFVKKITNKPVLIKKPTGISILDNLFYIENRTE